MENQEILNEITKSLDLNKEINENSEIKKVDIENKSKINKEIKIYLIHQTSFLDYIYRFFYKLLLITLIFFGFIFVFNYCVNYINDNIYDIKGNDSYETKGSNIYDTRGNNLYNTRGNYNQSNDQNSVFPFNK